MLQNRPISALQIGGSFTIDKSDQEALQVGSYRHFKWRQNDYKSGQQDYKSGQRLQIREEWFQIRAGIPNRCRTTPHFSPGQNLFKKWWKNIDISKGYRRKFQEKANIDKSW